MKRALSADRKTQNGLSSVPEIVPSFAVRSAFCGLTVEILQPRAVRQCLYGVLVYDHHNVIFAYGPFDRFRSILTSRSFRERDFCFPAPHSHS